MHKHIKQQTRKIGKQQSKQKETYKHTQIHINKKNKKMYKNKQQ